MNPEAVQKVLDFIREGAKAASGPASEAFKQVCAYKASSAMMDLVVTFVSFVTVATCAFFFVRYTLKNWNGSICENDFEPFFAIGSFVLSVGTIIMFIAVLSSVSTDIPTIHNPAGAILNQFVGH